MDYITKIAVKNIINSSYAAYKMEGNAVYQELRKALSNNEQVTCSFEDIGACSISFLDACIGELYRTFGMEKMQQLLTITETGGIDDFKEKLNKAISLIK